MDPGTTCTPKGNMKDETENDDCSQYSFNLTTSESNDNCGTVLTYTLGGGSISHSVVSWDGACCMDDFTKNGVSVKMNKEVKVDPTTCTKGLKYDYSGSDGDKFSYTLYDNDPELVQGFAVIKQAKFYCKISTLVPKCT